MTRAGSEPIDWHGREVRPDDVTDRIGVFAEERFYAMRGAVRMPMDLVTDFRAYRDAASSVQCRSTADVMRWLRGCKYVHDHVAYDRDDVWLHPADFERWREGDCEDHALWAWAQLCRAGLLARFVLGRSHAWVHYANRQSPEWFFLETTSKASRFRPALLGSTSHEHHVPEWSVDQDARFFLHGPAARDLPAPRPGSRSGQRRARRRPAR